MSFRSRNNTSRSFGKPRFSRGFSGGRGGGGGSRGRGRPEGNVASFIQKAIRSAQEGGENEVVTTTFNDYNLHPRVVENIHSLGFKTPTPIQHQAIPEILNNKDVIGLANTGTGKTAAFLIPLLHSLANNPQEKFLIVAPTRELAIQIDTTLKSMRRGIQAWSVLCIGGSSMYRQLDDLRKPHQFIIGTPGRLKDLSERRAINLAACTRVVLDEVDRMMDMGFMPDMKYLLGKMPSQRQSLFFSATMSAEIHALTQQFLTNSVTVSVKMAEVSSDVEHRAIPVSLDGKLSKLVELLNHQDMGKAIVFGRTKQGVKKLMFRLREEGFRAESLHGNKTQGQRKQALQAFRDNHVNILVATDVASRGIDVADITHVFNYDAPETYDDYVHRIGRTGRAGNKGIALSFVS